MYVCGIWYVYIYGDICVWLRHLCGCSNVDCQHSATYVQTSSCCGRCARTLCVAVVAGVLGHYV